MKPSTKFKKILELEDSDLKLLKLYNLAFNQMPGSIIQKQITSEINRLRDLGYVYDGGHSNE